MPTAPHSSHTPVLSYQSMSDHLKTHPLFRHMTEEQEEDMMDGIEKHLMTNIYTKWVELMGVANQSLTR